MSGSSAFYVTLTVSKSTEQVFRGLVVLSSWSRAFLFTSHIYNQRIRFKWWHKVLHS